MIKFLFRNAAFIFLANNILFSIVGYLKLSNYIFIGLLSVFLIAISLSPDLIKKLILNKGFKLYFTLNLINVLYYVFVEFGDFDSLKYLFARFLQFALFSSTIYYYGEKTKHYLGDFIKYSTLASLAISLFFIFPDFNTRYQGVFYNPNEFSVLMVYGFSSFLFLSKKTVVNVLILIIFIFMIIISGSRVALILAFIAPFIYYKNSIKYLYLIVPILMYFLIPFIGDSNSISRLLQEDIFENRKYEYLYAIETFLQNPLVGHGLKNHSYIDHSLIKFTDQQIDFGAHNGYLSLIVQYGLIFSSAIILYVGRSVFNVIKKIRKNIDGEPIDRLIYFIIIYTLINGLFENSFSGINYFQSSLFWFILGLFLYSNFKRKSEV